MYGGIELREGTELTSRLPGLEFVLCHTEAIKNLAGVTFAGTERIDVSGGSAVDIFGSTSAHLRSMSLRSDVFRKT